MKNREHADSVTRMQEYIKENLNEEISLHKLGSIAGYSPWHSAKMFKEYTGLSPFEYIRKLRLTGAALRLRDEKKKVLDTALDYVFDSHEGFSRAFKRSFGITPKAYTKATPPIELFMPYPANAFLIMEDDKSDLPELSKKFRVSIIDFPERKAIIKRGRKANNYFEYVDEVGCEIWGILVSVKEALYEPIGMWLPDKFIKKGTSRYVQGVEVPLSYSNKIPSGFDIITLPESKMMIFQGEAFDDERFDEAVINLSDIINEYFPGNDGYKWDEENPFRIQLEPEGYRGYIEGKAVKKK